MFIFNKADVHNYLKQGNDINIKDEYGNGFLFKNFRTNLRKYHNIEVVKTFINSGIDINAVNNKGETALFGEQDERMIKLFLNAGMNVNHINKAGKNALSSGINAENASLLCKNNCEILDVSDNLVIKHLLTTKDIKFIDFLMSKGIEINDCKILTDKTNDDLELIEYLLEKGVKLEKTPGMEYVIDSIGDKVLEKLISANYFNEDELQDIGQKYIGLSNNLYIHDDKHELLIFNKLLMLLLCGVKEEGIKIQQRNKVFKRAKDAFLAYEQEKEILEIMNKSSLNEKIKSKRL